MFLAYLHNPHARELGLKPLAENLLNWPPEERDAVAEWVMQHSEELLRLYPWNAHNAGKNGKISKMKAGAWIFAAPAQLVAPYACGDVARTKGLFRDLYPKIVDAGMLPAYDRERQLQPILMANERDGIHVDLDGLHRDKLQYNHAFVLTENWLRDELHASGLNFDADQDVAQVLLQRGIVAAEDWVSTKTGLSMSKDNLRPEHFTGPNGAAIASALGYRNRMKTCLTMFIEPWLAQGEQRNGVISTNWNQVRNPEGGTRTGRPSTTNPNFLNISKDFESKRDDGFEHPEFLGVPHLPLCRKYMIPDPTQVWIHRDFSGQEMRIFAHFEQGALWRAFWADPDLDPHEMVGGEFMRVAGREFERTKVKTLNFQGLYGGGLQALMNKLRCSSAEAKELKHFHDLALPGRKLLNEEIVRVIRRGIQIRTWGGRYYTVEPAGFSKKHGRHMTYEYKLINYIIQGSGADVTKQAIIDWHNHPKKDARFLVTVYDEINLSAPRGDFKRQMLILKEVMEAERISVPMRSDGKISDVSWGALKKFPNSELEGVTL
jgi:DNA polymerase I-like protein with 3'-5' exonuclease and polymerase domains